MANASSVLVINKWRVTQQLHSGRAVLAWQWFFFFFFVFFFFFFFLGDCVKPLLCLKTEFVSMLFVGHKTSYSEEK